MRGKGGELNVIQSGPVWPSLGPGESHNHMCGIERDVGAKEGRGRGRGGKGGLGEEVGNTEEAKEGHKKQGNQKDREGVSRSEGNESQEVRKGKD